MNQSDFLETGLSHSDEAAGRILLRGHNLADLAGDWTYEQIAAVLWHRVVPVVVSPADLGDARVQAFQRLAALEPLVRGRDAADAMRVLVAAMPGEDAASAVFAVAWIGVSAAAAARSQAGQPWATPDAGRAHAADLLAMTTGVSPEADVAHAFEAYCGLMIDHGVNASTYVARVAASAGSTLNAALLAALSTLQGARHGGAPALVLDQLDRLADPAAAVAFVAQEKAAGRRIAGFGSRAYGGRDPRADLLKRQWLAIGGDCGRRADAEAMEAALAAALAGSATRKLQANVEYYAALLMEAAGLPRCAFTPMFAAARAAGWVAHYHEQVKAGGRMLRPTSRYVGEPIVDRLA